MFEVIRDNFPEYDKFDDTNWIEPILKRYDEVKVLKEQMGDRDHALVSDFYFALRLDPARAADDNTFELYVCYKIPYLEQGKFPWESPFGIREVLPDGFPETEDEDNGLMWIKGDMETLRTLMVSAGFEEKPDIIPLRVR